jgi:hypothetical protein
VKEYVAVGVAGQALGVVQREAANAEQYARFEFVRVVTKADARIHIDRMTP